MANAMATADADGGMKMKMAALAAVAALCCLGLGTARASESGVVAPAPPSSASASAQTPTPTAPFVAGRTFVDGSIGEPRDGGVDVVDVYGCCSSVDVGADECPEGTDAAHRRLLSRVRIGSMPQMTGEQSLAALQSAVRAWDGGSGTWPQMSLSERIAAIEKFMSELQHRREDMINVLMYEIGKNRLDAESEFDRTMQFSRKTIEHIRGSGEFGSGWDASNGSTRLFLSRAAIGVVLCLGPYNYPLNETYATLIPALLMGNIVILKIPTVGGLVHLLTMDAFSRALPPGTINFVSGSGRKTMPPLMESGRIDSLAFIGGSGAADRLIKAHPEPHSLKLFLQLEAKNMGIYLPDLFESEKRLPAATGKESEAMRSHLDRVLKETITGSLSYNGQRCTALKLLFVPEKHGLQFANLLARNVENMSVGLPWERTNSKYSQITPLPNKARVQYMNDLIEDAVAKGAVIVNKNGGAIVGEGGGEGGSTLMIPAVLYPVEPGMRVYDEEQFGPVVPVSPYASLDDVLLYAREGKYGQQASIFTYAADAASARLVDRFSTVFGKININSQCGRSPDTAPFSGRRSSAMGVMSVASALHEFSVPTVVSYKDVEKDGELVAGIQGHSKFLQSTA